MNAATELAYSNVQYLYDFFNKRLFAGELPGALLTFQRQANAYGYYSNKRFVKMTDGQAADEIALNPVHFDEGRLELCQTLVHEMAHQWQAHFGTKSRAGYHNTEWAEKMESIGLMPTDTGKPGGKKTGQKMADYPINDGQFMKAFHELTEGREIVLYEDVQKPYLSVAALMGGVSSGGSGAVASVPAPRPEKPKSKCKYSCQCKPSATNFWAKPGLRNVRCDGCNELFIEQD